MIASTSRYVLCTIIYLITCVGTWAQSSPAAQSASPMLFDSQNQTTLRVFQQQRQALMQERQALVEQGATQEQLITWRQQNAARFAALDQQAQDMSAASTRQLRPTNRQPNIPSNASPALAEFLTTQTALANARAQIHNQVMQSLPANATAAQVAQMERQEIQAFHQQHASDLQLQRQRAQNLTASASQTPMRIPAAVVIPPTATPQMAAFLNARNQLAQQRAQLWNQNMNASPATRAAAMQQWRQQNAAQIQQLQQQAQDLSETTTVN